MRKFEKDQANIWASYHNSKVILLYKSNAIVTKSISPDRKIVIYYFEDETIPVGFETKELLFEDFIGEIKNSGLFYFGHHSMDLTKWYWHIDAYTSFTKESLDKFLNDHTDKKAENKYNFLF